MCVDYRRLNMKTKNSDHKESGDLQIIYDTLLAEYDVEEERLRQDLSALLGEISKLGLITMETRT